MANREKLIWREIDEIQKSKKYKIEFFLITVEKMCPKIKREKKRQTKLKKKTEKISNPFF